MSKTIYDFSIKDINGNETSLSDFKGKTLLIVNVASKCGFTPQYKDLEILYKNYKDKDFAVLGFPCNQFGAQEPGDEQEIKNFCSLNYEVTFPLFSKVDVNGKDTHPVYEYLKNAAPGLLGSKAIKWNFTKFLVSKDGQIVKRFAPTDKPLDLETELKKII
jgi:glutathione peroxidase